MGSKGHSREPETEWLTVYVREVLLEMGAVTEGVKEEVPDTEELIDVVGELVNDSDTDSVIGRERDSVGWMLSVRVRVAVGASVRVEVKDAVCDREAEAV